MEQRIELKTATHFTLTNDELKRFYVAMALCKYLYVRKPDYNEKTILLRLRNEFNRFNDEIIKVCEQDPNNLVLSQIRGFIQEHYGRLKKMSI